ncbi:MAG: EamA family transporter, partial [Gammaproteobacteria bacterium]
MKSYFSLKTKIALFLAVTLWASAFVGIRAGLEGYTPGGLALLRFIIASFCMLIIYFRLPQRTAICWGDKGLLLLVGMFGVGCYNIALNYGEIAVSSGIASFIISLSPIVTLIFAILFLRESISLNMVVGTIISIIGVGLIMLSKTNQFDFHLGVFYVLIASIIGGAYSVLQKPFLKKHHAIEVTAYIMWGATILLLIYAPDALRDIKTASYQATFSVIYLGIFPAAIGYIAWSYGLKEVPASQAVNFLYFMPLIATFLGWVCLGEIPTWLSLVGGLVALFGVWVVNHPRERKLFSRKGNF